MTRGKDEAWRSAKRRVDRLSGPAQAKALVQEIQKQGLDMSEVVGRIVVEFLGENPSDDQVRSLAASLAFMLDMRPNSFVDFWREFRCLS